MAVAGVDKRRRREVEGRGAFSGKGDGGRGMGVGVFVRYVFKKSLNIISQLATDILAGNLFKWTY